VPAGAQLHRSIIERMQAWADYRPPNLDPGFVKRVLAGTPVTETLTYTPNPSEPAPQTPAAAGRLPG
jgi:hypothetical protein